MTPRSFTLKANKGLFKQISTPLEIIVPNKTDSINIHGIWDTGATGSVITKKVADSLNIQPTGIKRVHTANGIADQRTFTINIKLPNSITVKDVSVTEVAGLSGGMDALIGMDIICLGDLSITHHNGNSCMSFRIPSSHEIDFVKSPDFGIVQIEQAANQNPINPYAGAPRNQPCPCGSEKKFKHCHGK